MPRKKLPGLTDAPLRLIQVLWERVPAAASEGCRGFALLVILAAAFAATPATQDAPLAQAPAQAAPAESSPVRDWIAANAIKLSTPEAGHGFGDMQALKKVVGDARIVALGEATHGTREFFQLKHRMMEFLATQMGFTIFSIEANMPEAYRLNDYVLHGTGDPASLLKGMYFWTWDTQEVLAMVKWMREFNASGKGRVQFTGFDMQTPNVALKIVGDFLSGHDPEYSATVRKTFDMALAPAAQQSQFASATGSFPPEAAAGKRVRFSGYIKTEAVSGGYAGLWWRADGSGGPLVFKNLGDRAPSGTTDWTKFDLEATVPPETRNINFGALLAGEGTAWFDGLTVELDGVRYENENVFGFLRPNPYRQGPYQFQMDSETIRGGHSTLQIRRSGQPANAVDPKAASAAWRELVAHMEGSRGKYGANPETEWAVQNARVVLQCTEMRSNEVSRDASMAANIQWILDQNPGARIVVWAHNAHVSTGGTPFEGPMGASLRKIYGSQMVVFGFAFNQGSFQAVDQGKGLRDFTVPPSPAGSLGAMLASTGIPMFALDLRQVPKAGPVAEWFGEAHKARGAGAVYSEDHASQYINDLNAKQAFDALLFVEKTTAARKNGPLPSAPPAAQRQVGQDGLAMKPVPVP